MDESALAKRVLQLEIALATLQSEYRGHVELCNGKWRAANHAAAAAAGLIALVVSVAVAVYTRQ